VEKDFAWDGVADDAGLVMDEVFRDLGRNDRPARFRQSLAQQTEHSRLGDEHEAIELMTHSCPFYRPGDLARELLGFVTLGAALAVDGVPRAMRAAEAAPGAIALQIAILEPGRFVDDRAA
jgi:hypothetical protein